MQFEGIHHITAITGDAPRNVDFYARVLGLRLVKKTVNQDDPSVYHLFYADEQGSPGADMTFFEYPGSPRGRAGAGMVHQIGWRVADAAALDFWAARLGDEGIVTERDGDRLRFADREGLAHELVVADVADAALIAEHPEVAPEVALRGFDGVRAYNDRPERSAQLLTEVLNFRATDDGGRRFEARGEQRGGTYTYDPAPEQHGLQGAGTVHHVAWSAALDEIEPWQQLLQRTPAVRPTPVIDRFYFRSVYFREPSGVLFEIATRGPGFDVDEDAARLGESVALPPFLESRREQIERTLTPLPNPRPAETS
ncbi:VOC family protein [Capillimicrobium parvum]|uniref:Ring-cleaving dioxygenase MhqA n=1 Tax=Capillimicrobium parvum TaxID=2884022 RepID=A0A9E7C050_9ACTN|nr:VOC family protein [Capillimicrobium parvum]UGS36060.1 Putative ring-cleaving dioxygenase MhqA [Capillimicrobium parvum]